MRRIHGQRWYHRNSTTRIHHAHGNQDAAVGAFSLGSCRSTRNGNTLYQCARDAFTSLQFDEIVAVADERNHASLRIIDKLGMQFAGYAIHYGSLLRKYSIARSRSFDRLVLRQAQDDTGVQPRPSAGSSFGRLRMTPGYSFIFQRFIKLSTAELRMTRCGLPQDHYSW